MCAFGDLEIGEEFMIPSGFSPQEMEAFVKLRFNKARSKETDRVEHFNNTATVWPVNWEVDA